MHAPGPRLKALVHRCGVFVHRCRVVFREMRTWGGMRATGVRRRLADGLPAVLAGWVACRLSMQRQHHLHRVQHDLHARTLGP